MIVVGELINMTRKKPQQAWEARDEEVIAQLARDQAEAGADYIDVNGGVAGEEVACMEWLVNVVQKAVDLPLCIDTTNPEALEKALSCVKRPPLVNSVSAEKDRWSRFLPLLKGVPCKVVALLVGDGGLPKSVQDRLDNAGFLMDKLCETGVSVSDIFIDPCVIPVSTDTPAGTVFLQSIPALRQRWPEVHFIAGLSNISFGLPARSLMNRVFLSLAMGAGMDGAILNPTDPHILQVLLSAEALLGRDAYCRKYIQGFRKGLFA
jgi:5-methyltetrahydrofolate corrinoid/iron sulfur protein methyltransferase